MSKTVSIDKQDFINSVNEGLNRKELAAKYNTNVPAINQAMKSLGLKCKKGKKEAVIVFTTNETTSTNQLTIEDELTRIESETTEAKTKSLVDFSPYKNHMPISGC